MSVVSLGSFNDLRGRFFRQKSDKGSLGNLVKCTSGCTATWWSRGCPSIIIELKLKEDIHKIILVVNTYGLDSFTRTLMYNGGKNGQCKRAVRTITLPVTSDIVSGELLEIVV